MSQPQSSLRAPWVELSIGQANPPKSGLLLKSALDFPSRLSQRSLVLSSLLDDNPSSRLAAPSGSPIPLCRSVRWEPRSRESDPFLPTSTTTTTSTRLCVSLWMCAFAEVSRNIGKAEEAGRLRVWPSHRRGRWPRGSRGEGGRKKAKSATRGRSSGTMLGISGNRAGRRAQADSGTEVDARVAPVDYYCYCN